MSKFKYIGKDCKHCKQRLYKEKDNKDIFISTGHMFGIPSWREHSKKCCKEYTSK